MHCDSLHWRTGLWIISCLTPVFGTADHWQNKGYPYPPYQVLTLGDGILRGLDMENEYWWVWLGIGVNLAYILLMNVVIIICLAYLPGELQHVKRFLHIKCVHLWLLSVSVTP